MNLEEMIGFGIAGNFAGHLEQAGESKDFEHLSQKGDTPKGLFPFYLPHSPCALGVFPLSSSTILLPSSGENVQVEPEIALICDLIYGEDNDVIEVIPRYFSPFNDGSIRREGAKKISEKKNWGECSKGISSTFFPINTHLKGGIMDHYRLGCYLVRGGESFMYGVDSPCDGYTYFHEELTQWLVRQLNTQKDEGPLEDLQKILKEVNYPKQAIVTIGATRYTPFGEKTYLQKGDEVVIVAYPKTLFGQPLPTIVSNGEEVLSLTLKVY